MADVLQEQVGAALFIRLNRPERLNAFSRDMLESLKQALDWARDCQAVRVVVISGEGRAFSAGGDVKAMAEAGSDLVFEHIELLVQTVEAMTRLEKPIIAAVHGVAAGAGFNLVLASDLVIAGETSRFVMSFVDVGLVSDGGGLWFLPRMVGMHRANQLLYFGEPILAPQAQQWGIVNRVVADDQVMQAAGEWAQTLARKPRRALAHTKRLLQLGGSTGLDELMRQEQTTQMVLSQTNDHREGVAAFKEKRRPNFSE